MTDWKTFLSKLHQNLSTLREREARYGGNAPLELLNQITDHQQAIALTERTNRGEITEAEWRETTCSLPLAIREGQVVNIDTGGGAYIEGTVNVTEGDFVGRDKIVHIHESAPTRPPEPIPTFIPNSRASNFVGRVDELEWLCQRLKAGDVAAVAGVRGIGGIGKTELAIAAVNELKPHFGEAHIFWLDCGPNPVQAIQERLAAALDVILTGDDLRLRADSLALALRQRPATLVVLDDLRRRHLAELEYILPPRPPCALLVTSRRDDIPLIPPRALKKLDVLKPDQAGHLLTGLLQNDEIIPVAELVAAISELLEHIPLALTLAARRRNIDPLTILPTLLAELRQRRRVLVLELGERPDLSIMTTFQASYEELDEADRARLYRLGVFARSEFELLALQAVWEVDEETTRHTLVNLTNAGLLEEVDDETWWMHDLLREYAADRLAQAEAGEGEAARLNHATFWHGYLNNLTLRNLTDWRSLEVYRPEVEIAANWLAATPACPLHLQVSLPYAIATTFPNTTFPWLEKMLRAALNAAHAWQQQAETEDALKTRKTWLAVTQSSLADLLRTRGQYDEAERLYRLSLTVCEDIGDRRSVAVTQSSLADLLRTRGQYDEAERLYQSGLTICHEVHDLQGIGVFLMGVGQIALVKGQRDEAIAMFQEAQHRFLAIGLPNWAASAEKLLHQAQGEPSQLTLEDVLAMVQAAQKGDQQAGQQVWQISQGLKESSDPTLLGLGHAFEAILVGLPLDEAIVGLPAELRAQFL